MQLMITASKKTLKQIQSSEISGITDIRHMGGRDYLITGIECAIDSIQEYLIDIGQKNSSSTPYEDHNINFYCS